MSAGVSIPLRDIHLPQAPGWWPPAPGWWLLAALAAGLITLAVVLLWRRTRRRRRLLLMFDRRVADAGDAPAQIAAMSELLRRAVLERDRPAATLQGEQWLAYLDRGARTPVFAGEPGRLLLEGGYRRAVDADGVEALRLVARARFLELAGGRR